jgi:uncharacterized membrane protein YvbJ
MSLHIAGEKLMVYCSKCGTKNEDDAMVCVNCGASLETGARLTRRYERRMEQECFGIPRGGSIVGMIIGLIIVLIGISLILPYNIPIGAIVVIIFGILIIVGAYYGMRRRS